MELILSLLGLGGLALLLQSKPLPTEKDAIKASEKLDKDPNDPAANTTVGMYVAFVLGKFTEAMPYLAKSSDSTLKNLAEHELDPAYTGTPDKQVKLGNDWVQAASKFPLLVAIFYDRAAYWYKQAWPDLKEPDKAKLRIQAQRLATPRRPGPPRKKLPLGWITVGVAVTKPTELDNTIARTGSYSAKTFPTKEDIPGYSGLQSIHYPVKGSSYEASVFVRSNETDSQEDSVTLRFYNSEGLTHNADQKKLLPADLPFWHYVSFKGIVSPGAQEAAIMVHQYSKRGNLWIDDASLRFNLIEDLKNGSFEEK